MGKKSINVLCPAFIALKNDYSRYFHAENGFSLGPGKHKNAERARKPPYEVILTIVWRI